MRSAGPSGRASLPDLDVIFDVFYGFLITIRLHTWKIFEFLWISDQSRCARMLSVCCVIIKIFLENSAMSLKISCNFYGFLINLFLCVYVVPYLISTCLCVRSAGPSGHASLLLSLSFSLSLALFYEKFLYLCWISNQLIKSNELMCAVRCARCVFV